ncbi:MAG: hypothetical protein LBE09_09105 [Christensenellaceae bacterium]|jgi:nitrogen regulatory protein PII|nr:hypothetical protein [Christensenellaceae bacterium]
MENKIEFLIVIGVREQKAQLLTTLAECGAAICHVVYGKGIAKDNELLHVLSLVPERNKVIILSLIKSSKVDNCLELLDNKHEFNKSNTGIAFTMPVESVVY